MGQGNVDDQKQVSNGAAPFKLDLAPGAATPEQLAHAFTHVPWIEFNVTAKANLNAFAKSSAVQQVVAHVAQATVNNVTNTLVNDLTNKFHNALQQAVQEATNTVSAQITANMNDLFKGLNIDAQARPVTDYQHLRDPTNDDVSAKFMDINFNGPTGGLLNIGGQNIVGNNNDGNTFSPFSNNQGNTGYNGGGLPPSPLSPPTNPTGPTPPVGPPGGTSQAPPGAGSTSGNIASGNGIINGGGGDVTVNSNNRDTKINYGPGSGDVININNNDGPQPGQPQPDINQPAALPDITNPDLANGLWIWTPEQPIDNPPQAPRGFRKTATLPLGKFVDSVTIDITCDNFQTCYVNGYCLGYGLDLRIAHRWSITIPRTNKLVIAVYAANDPDTKNVAGLIAAAVAWDSSKFQGETYKINTDETWKCTIAPPPAGFERPTYNDNVKSWVGVRVEGPLATTAPWNTIGVIKPTQPEKITEGFKAAQTHGIGDAPRTTLANPGPGTPL